MAATIASAYVQLLPSFKGGAAAISKEMDGPLDSAGRDGGRRFGGGMTSGIAGMARSIFAPLAAAAAGVGLVGMFKGAITEASGLNESLNAINVSYGEAAAGVQQLGKGAATSLGLSNLEFNNLAVRFSSFSKTIAGDGGDVTGTLDQLTRRASDFASVMNLEVADAAQLFQSGLAGESEPLRQFGIDLSAAAVEAYGLANGLSANGKSLTEAEKIQARYGLLMQQTAQTQGDFANTSDQLANQQRILGARFDDLKANLGARLLPVITSVVSFLNANMQPAFETVSGGVRALVAAFQAGGSDVTSSGFAGVMERIGLAARVVANFFTGTVISGVRAMVAAFQAGGSDVTSSGFAGIMERIGLAARALADWIRGSLVPGLASLVGWLKENAVWLTPVAVGVTAMVAAYKAYQTYLLIVVSVTKAYAAAQVILNAVMAANPLGIVVLAIIGLVAALVYAWHNSETFRTIVTGVWESIKTAVLAVVDWFQVAVPAVFEFIKNAFLNYTILGLVISHWDTIMAVVLGVVNWLRAAPGAAFEFIKNAFLQYTVLGLVISHWSQIQTAVSSAISNTIEFVRAMPGRIVDALGNLGSLLYEAGKNVLQGLIEGIGDKVGDAVRAVRKAVSSVIDGAKDLLGINSPSRVFMEIGSYTGQGFALGIESERQAVEASMARMVAVPDTSSISAGSAANGRPGSGAAQSFDYDRLAAAMSHVQLGLDGRSVSQSVDQRIGERIR